MNLEPHVRTIYRWVWSKLENVPGEGWKPIAREYAVRWHAPNHFDCGWALCHCEMMHEQYEAALLDPRLMVLDDLHSHAPIPEQVAIALGPKFGVSLKDTAREMLVKMSRHHLSYLPET